MDAKGLILHTHHYFRFGPPFVAGSELTFVFNSEGQSPLSFQVVIPETWNSSYPWNRQTFEEGDAATLGLDWGRLEELMAGAEPKETIWGPPDAGAMQYFPYPIVRGPEVYAKVDLDQIVVEYQGISNLSSAFIYFNGERFLVPEPSSAFLSVCCVSALLTMAPPQARYSRELK